MLKKIASSFILASALVGTMVAPSYADDDTFKNICLFPVKVVGSGVGAVVGVPLGAVKDGTKGAIKSTTWVAGKLGNYRGSHARVDGDRGRIAGNSYLVRMRGSRPLAEDTQRR